MNTVKILTIGDMQNGFTREDGNLYVRGACEIISPTNQFLRQVKNGIFDYVIIIQDTHFSEEYYQTEEGKIFPIHCEYGTNDWELAIDISNLSNIHYLMKNQFNMWGQKKETKISFSCLERKKAYDNLFHVVDNPHNPSGKTPRNDFIRAISPDHNAANIEVTMVGVASDYCNRYSMEGWLERGARVTIIQDLTKGIEKETPEIVDENKYQKYKNNRLRAVNSDQFLTEVFGSKYL